MLCASRSVLAIVVVFLLWVFRYAQDFREPVARAVNLGDDADTTGAVCGQFAGAYWGEAGIPVEWLGSWQSGR